MREHCADTLAVESTACDSNSSKLASTRGEEEANTQAPSLSDSVCRSEEAAGSPSACSLESSESSEELCDSDEEEDEEASRSEEDELDSQAAEAASSQEDSTPPALQKLTLKMWDFGQCDSKRCSGRKLKRHGKVAEQRKGTPFRGIILSAEARKLLTASDREVVTKRGVCVIDCSWNRITEIPTRKLIATGEPRKLPYLIAASPCHYGRPFELNCAEALAATLFITGYYKEAAWLLSSFKWGHTFFEINKAALDAYCNCRTEAELLKAQDKVVARRSKRRLFF